MTSASCAKSYVVLTTCATIASAASLEPVASSSRYMYLPCATTGPSDNERLRARGSAAQRKAGQGRAGQRRAGQGSRGEGSYLVSIDLYSLQVLQAVPDLLEPDGCDRDWGRPSDLIWSPRIGQAAVTIPTRKPLHVPVVTKRPFLSTLCGVRPEPVLGNDQFPCENGAKRGRFRTRRSCLGRCKLSLQRSSPSRARLGSGTCSSSSS